MEFEQSKIEFLFLVQTFYAQSWQNKKNSAENDKIDYWALIVCKK